MADAEAGFSGSLRVQAVGGSYDDLGGAYDVDFTRVMEELDSTDFADSDTQRVYGLGDVEFSVTAIWDPDDAGQTTIETEKDSRNNVDVEYLPDGTNGYEAECMVTDENVTQAVDGRVEISYTFMLANGSLTRV